MATTDTVLIDVIITRGTVEVVLVETSNSYQLTAHGNVTADFYTRCHIET